MESAWLSSPHKRAQVRRNLMEALPVILEPGFRTKLVRTCKHWYEVSTTVVRSWYKVAKRDARLVRSWEMSSCWKTAFLLGTTLSLSKKTCAFNRSPLSQHGYTSSRQENASPCSAPRCRFLLDKKAACFLQRGRTSICDAREQALLFSRAIQVNGND
jgi:hypothetical protein